MRHIDKFRLTMMVSFLPDRRDPRAVLMHTAEVLGRYDDD
jgi:hypothetical protein